jgi:saccharopine dehydrogenase-like NADP-dependent oxidoreductase
MRWPGHNQFWNAMAELGFLDGEPLRIGDAEVSPRRFVSELLKPRLQFGKDEKDIVIVRVEAWGLKDGRPLHVSHELIDFRDLETGFFAMNRTVGFTASIAAQMILDGKISKPGVLSPARDVPLQEVLGELEKRGIKISRREKWD